jgi:dihydropteroate synthase
LNTAQFKQWGDFCSQSTLSTNPQQTLIMGILNVTPDSFSDGGTYYAKERAVEHAHRMIAEGADLIDIGGESSRPGALPVSLEEELARVIPVIEHLRAESDVCISIDTTKAEVMQAAVCAGASIINDIMALRGNGALAMAAQLNVPVCLMHMQGEPRTMQNNPQYKQDVVDEINAFFQQRIEACLSAGIAYKNLILDPGFGFGKTPEHNLRIVNQLAKFHSYHLPLMLGVSRKSTLGIILNTPVDKRVAGDLAIAVVAALQGVAIIRTHEVFATKQALVMVHAISSSTQAGAIK